MFQFRSCQLLRSIPCFATDVIHPGATFTSRSTFLYRESHCTTSRRAFASIPARWTLSSRNGFPDSKMVKRKTAETPPKHPELKHPTTSRAKEIDANTPYEALQSLLESQKDNNDIRGVLHWFRSEDLRIHDNRALHAASELAKEASVPLICVYLHCPAELNWHGTSPARTDFILENLKLIQQELNKLDVPLAFLEVPERNEIVPSILNFIKDNGVSHVFANYEYEIDELRRDIKVLRAAVRQEFQVILKHDQTVMEPLTILTGSGTPMKVFTPYHKAWCAEVAKNPSLLDTVPAPSKNIGSAKKDLAKLFDSKVPTIPKEKDFSSDEERKKIRNLWPAGHAAGVDRMNKFIGRIDSYAETRTNPAKDSTSRMSAYFNAGVVSMREVLQLVKQHNNGSANFGSSAASQGVYSWVREIVFRELYRQTGVATPHIAMNLPNNLKFEFVKWEDDEEGYKRWEGM